MWKKCVSKSWLDEQKHDTKTALKDNSKRPVQHSGFIKKEEAEKEKYKVISQLENGTYVVYTNVTVEMYMEYWYEFIIKYRLNSEGSVRYFSNR